MVYIRFFIEKNEQIAHFLKGLTKPERMSDHFFERIAHLLMFGQKPSNSLGKPMSQFPAMVFWGPPIKSLHNMQSFFVCAWFHCIWILGWVILGVATKRGFSTLGQRQHRRNKRCDKMSYKWRWTLLPLFLS